MIIIKRYCALLMWATVLTLSVSCPVNASEKPKVFYVSTDGDDTNSGTRNRPFASVLGAQQAVRKFRQGHPNKPVKVLIAAGAYRLTEAIHFTAEDSGTESAPVSYVAMTNKSPVFSGGVVLTGWRLSTDADEQSRLSPTARGKVYVMDLNQTEVVDFGDPVEAGNRPELFCNGQLQQLARWPDEGFARSGKARGTTPTHPTYLKLEGTQEGIFEYLDPRANQWVGEDDIRLTGYFYFDWAEGFHEIEKIDTITQTITMKGPYHPYGYRDAFRYVALNVLKELDRPGEWYLDRKQRKLYWYPPISIDPSQAEVVLTDLNKSHMLYVEDCNFLTIKGLEFRESRGSAIRIKGGENCVIADCRIENMGRDGVTIEQGKQHRLTGNYIGHVGYGGIKVNAGDRRTLTHSEHIIDNNIVEYFSLFKRTYEPAVHFVGCGLTIRNNRFRHSSSSAMRLDGNEVLVEYNEISQVVNESDDQGGIDMYFDPTFRGNVFRYNYWSDIYGGTTHGAAAIRLDDMISGTLIYGNVFERCGILDFGAVQIHGGKENIIDNNLFYDCHAAVSLTPYTEARWLGLINEYEPVINKLYKDIDIRSAVYRERYPELANIHTGIFINTIKNNLMVDCAQEYIGMDEKQQLSNNHSVDADGKSLKQFLQSKKLKSYGIQPIPFKEMGLKNNRWAD